MAGLTRYHNLTHGQHVTPRGLRGRFHTWLYPARTFDRHRGKPTLITYTKDLCRAYMDATIKMRQTTKRASTAGRAPVHIETKSNHFYCAKLHKNAKLTTQLRQLEAELAANGVHIGTHLVVLHLELIHLRQLPITKLDTNICAAVVCLTSRFSSNFGFWHLLCEL